MSHEDLSGNECQLSWVVGDPEWDMNGTDMISMKSLYTRYVPTSSMLIALRLFCKLHVGLKLCCPVIGREWPRQIKSGWARVKVVGQGQM